MEVHMKKSRLLHAKISYLIANLGHTDRIVVADSGLPVPNGMPKIDLALTQGVPGFIVTLQTILSEMQIEKAWIAQELKQGGHPVYGELRDTLEGTEIELLSHERFKEMVGQHAVVVIRTGECTPFANVILQAGVVF
jgi:D-ribose pyranase